MMTKRQIRCHQDEIQSPVLNKTICNVIADRPAGKHYFLDRTFFFGYTSAILCLFLLGLFAYERNSIWKNEYTLWHDTVVKSPNKISPHINLGNAFIRRALLDRAESEFLAAVAIDKEDARAHIGLGIVYSRKGRPDDAIREFKIIIASIPEYPPGHYNLGVTYLQKGRLDDAIKEFQTTVQLAPDFPGAYASLGIIYKKKGLFKQARLELERALLMAPDNMDARKNLQEVMQLLQEDKKAAQ